MIWTHAEGGWWTQDVEGGAARHEKEHRGGQKGGVTEDGARVEMRQC